MHNIDLKIKTKQMQNSNSKAGTTADSSTQPKLKRQAKLLPNPLLPAALPTEYGNKLIQEFMKHLPQDEMVNEKRRELGVVEKNYHTSWDWLMPVCNKLDYLSENKVIQWSKDFECWADKLDDAVTITYTIQPVYKVVVEFIEWYNSQGVSKR